MSQKDGPKKDKQASSKPLKINDLELENRRIKEKLNWLSPVQYRKEQAA